MEGLAIVSAVFMCVGLIDLVITGVAIAITWVVRGRRGDNELEKYDAMQRIFFIGMIIPAIAMTLMFAYFIVLQNGPG